MRKKRRERERELKGGEQCCFKKIPVRKWRERERKRESKRKKMRSMGKKISF